MFGLVFGAHLEPCGSAWDSDLPCWAIPVFAGPQVKNIPTVSVSLNAIGGLTSPRKPWNLIHLAVSFKDVSCACSHLVWWPMFSSLLQAPFGTNFGTTCWCQTCSHYGHTMVTLAIYATGSFYVHHLCQAIAATPTEPEWWWVTHSRL